jgi:hypothetical protein
MINRRTCERDPYDLDDVQHRFDSALVEIGQTFRNVLEDLRYSRTAQDRTKTHSLDSVLQQSARPEETETKSKAQPKNYESVYPLSLLISKLISYSSNNAAPGETAEEPQDPQKSPRTPRKGQNDPKEAPIASASRTCK